jgi:hypothetical protein
MLLTILKKAPLYSMECSCVVERILAGRFTSEQMVR